MSSDQVRPTSSDRSSQAPIVPTSTDPQLRSSKHRSPQLRSTSIDLHSSDPQAPIRQDPYPRAPIKQDPQAPIVPVKHRSTAPIRQAPISTAPIHKHRSGETHTHELQSSETHELRSFQSSTDCSDKLRSLCVFFFFLASVSLCRFVCVDVFVLIFC